MQLGIGKAIITPKLGTRLAGYGVERFSENCGRPGDTRVLAFSRGKQTARSARSAS